MYKMARVIKIVGVDFSFFFSCNLQKYTAFYQLICWTAKFNGEIT